MTNIATAKDQTALIAAAINGDSNMLQTLGNIGTDPHPERLLAVGLAHAINALGALTSEVEALRRRVSDLETR